MKSNGERFLKAFQRVEGYLRELTGSDRHASFSDLLRAACRQSSIVRRYEKDLRALKDLRNVLVHDDGDFLAEPTDKAVQIMERIAEHLHRPPRVEDLFLTSVLSVRSQSPIAAAVRLMYEHDYSQVPVIENGEIVSLLTANTVARWIGALASEEVFSVEEAQVKDVLAYAEASEVWECLPRKATLFDVLERFEHHEREGRRLAAILITHSGKTTERLLGIITPWDLTRIHQVLEGRR